MAKSVLIDPKSPQKSPSTRGLKPVLSNANMKRKQFIAWLKKHSLKTVSLIVILFLILFGVSVFTKKPQPAPESPSPKPLKVQTMIVGSQNSALQTSGSIQNLSAVTLVAQTAGPVKKIFAVEGTNLKKGTRVVSQETGYGTGNASYIGVQIAEKNVQIAQTTLDNTVQSVTKAREIADKNRENTEELRKISADSIQGTRKVVDTTKQVIAKIESDIAATTDADIIQGLRQQLISFQNILNQSENGLKNLEYSTNTDKPQSKLADYAKDQVYLATQLQLDTTKLSKEISDLNLRSARIQASLSTVRSPFAGTVERVFVTEGQYVTPGTPVARITGTDAKLCLVIPISGFSAASIDENSSLEIAVNNQPYLIPITHVSSTPTNGQLYEVLATLPDSLSGQIFEGQTIEVSLPTIGSQNMKTKTSNVFIPLEAVFVTNTERYVYVYDNGIARRRVIQTKNVIGNEIEITEGLTQGEEIIIDRRVFEGQKVESERIINKVEERG